MSRGLYATRLTAADITIEIPSRSFKKRQLLCRGDVVNIRDAKGDILASIRLSEEPASWQSTKETNESVASSKPSAPGMKRIIDI